MSDHPGERVRVTSPRTLAVRSRSRRSNAAEIDAQTRLGEVYVQSLIRSQLRLALTVLLMLSGTVGLLPLLFALAPVVRRLELFGIPLPWLLLGAGVYPYLIWLAWWSARRAERNEHAFEDLVERP
jgi:hypothetical protein